MYLGLPKNKTEKFKKKQEENNAVLIRFSVGEYILNFYAQLA